MKILAGFSSFFVLIFIFSLQSSISSCTKEVTIYDTITQVQTDTLTKTDTLIISDTTVTLPLLTANAWKTEELKGVIGNMVVLYERGGRDNSENYDNEYISFNTDGTGILFDAAGSTHPITWAFDATTTSKLSFVVSNPGAIPSQTVFWENLRYKNGLLLYDQYWNYEGVNSHSQGVRSPVVL